jgi:RNA polymerase sigma factor (sigma-70 family)
MRIRAKLTLRNDKMLAARATLGINQAQLADIAKVPTTTVQELESLKYTTPDFGQRIKRVADALDLPVSDVAPPELHGQVIESTISRTTDIELRQLQNYRCLALPTPVEEVDAEDLRTVAKRKIDAVLKTLSYREREVIKLRYDLGGDGFTYTIDEVAHIFKVTRERIRQLEMKAIAKMQRPFRAAMLVGVASDYGGSSNVPEYTE